MNFNFVLFVSSVVKMKKILFNTEGEKLEGGKE
jgi:hypothetical protein